MSSSEAPRALPTPLVEVNVATTRPVRKANRMVRRNDMLGIPVLSFAGWSDLVYGLTAGLTALVDVRSRSLLQLQPRRLLSERAHARRRLPHGNVGGLPDLVLRRARLLRAREASGASGQSPLHQAAGIRQQRIVPSIERSRCEAQPRELPTS